MPGMALSSATIVSRRRLNSVTIIGMKAWSPRSASIAAFCTIEAGLDVLWLWISVMAAITFSGPAAYPMRQPVMACDFDRPLTRIVLSFISSLTVAMLANTKPS